jgi:hypothetical protein
LNASVIVYDCEIIKCIPPALKPDLQYCEGWHDHAGMGISVIGVYDYLTDQCRVFLKDNFADFVKLVRDREHVISFNSLAFDDKLCAAHGIKVKTTYDMLCEVRAASGQPREYVYGQTRKGYSLEALARANLGTGKSGSGAFAPELWQRGQRGAVIDYCLGDVALTKRLFDRRAELIDPTGRGMLTLREPEGWK